MQMEVLTIKTLSVDVWNTVDKGRKGFVESKKTTWERAALTFFITFQKSSGIWEILPS